MTRTQWAYGMNARQEIFVREYVRCGVAAEAARRAGYSEKAARQQGHELLTNPNVLEAIGALRAELAEVGRISRDEWIQGLVNLARVGETDHVRLQALREIGKAFGWYEPERQERVLSGGITFLPPLENP